MALGFILTTSKSRSYRSKSLAKGQGHRKKTVSTSTESVKIKLGSPVPTAWRKIVPELETVRAGFSTAN